MSAPIRLRNGRQPRGGRRRTQPSDALPVDTDYTLAQVEAHARREFPEAFDALPPASNEFLDQTIDQKGSPQRVKMGVIRLNGIDYALSAYMRLPYDIRFSYDAGKCPLPDHIRKSKLDHPFCCPLATSRPPVDVYPELESLVAFYMVRQGIIPNFRDHGCRTRPSLSALQRACMTVLKCKPQGDRAPMVPGQDSRAGDVRTPDAPAEPSLPASYPGAGTED
ncbi:uncharacterized protein N0V89_011473 [Didymosphaeria variabile]|uniref:Uncharacterized protein n=1 Tax=Didymosphaeria variabile TaxID=1932322 RepID=A0A9W8XBC5_9PLEO|nr:uncharacterized protein N0V89_011473 [Didymosphaeria variabile]KAJ4345343.1 hypothetical protein N0V89_011473 [Didymosphaeria variabile]